MASPGSRRHLPGPHALTDATLLYTCLLCSRTLVASIPYCWLKQGFKPVTPMATVKGISAQLNTDAQYQELVTASDTAVFISSAEGKTELINQNASTLLGYTAEEIVEIPTLELFSEDSRDLLLARIARGGNGEILFPAFTARMLNSAGEEIPIEFIGLPIQWRGAPAFLNFIRDTSLEDRLRERLQQAEKLHSIGTLAGGIAHDFNNTLTGIFGNLSLAQAELDHAHPGSAYLQSIEKAMARATALTERLLTFAKGGDPVRDAVSLDELIRETVHFELSGSNVRADFCSDSDLWMADVDRGQVQQIISNLTVNANQAMPTGGY